MTDPRFIHLRLHSEYSIVDGIARYGDVVKRARADGMPAMAVTDLANGFGYIKFYKTCRGKGIKPILGADVWITNDEDRDKPFRLLLLAANNDGYRNLCELLSRAWLENCHRERGEIRMAWFDEIAKGGPGGQGGTASIKSSDGLIVLSGAQGGEIGAALETGNLVVARDVAQRLAATFPGRFYIEVQRCGAAGEERYIRAALRVASDLKLPVVATHPIQFVEPEDFRPHEARVCIAQGEALANPRRQRRFTEQQYMKSQDEMCALFADIPSALTNAVEIAKRCNISLTLGKPQLPQFPTPEGMTLDDYLRHLAHEGLMKRMEVLFPNPAERDKEMPRYLDRLKFECDTIVQMGFPGYFLIVADFINWAKNNGVPVGPGRGSGAGSLVAFSLGITDLDPLPYALLFERFLNPERVSMPDFDIDFCQDNRYKVIEYVRRRYGYEAVSQIATFGTMASKAVIRDAGRVLDLPYNFCDQLSKLIPVVQNKPLSLAEARKEEPLLAEREEKEDEVRELLALAEPLEDMTRNIGMHAGGVIIAPGRLTDFTPLYQAPGTEAVVSMYDKDDVEAAGLVKFDFLGLRNLTIIQLAVDYINGLYPERKFQLEELNGFDDPRAYQVLKDANTTAIFQLESAGMKKLLAKLAPDRFEDIIAVLALYRPGPLGSGMVDDFILRKKGLQAIDYFIDDLKACLEPTYGVIVYQEQVMQISQIIAGYTLGGADLLRRAMGKKKPEEMAKQREIFMAGAAEKKRDLELAKLLFDLMEKFAEYGFNKSHTAAYAVVTYQTAWLKAHYPAEFMAATLSSDMDDTDKVQLFVEDALLNRVAVLPPDVNMSGYRFQPVWAELDTRVLKHLHDLGKMPVRLAPLPEGRKPEFKKVKVVRYGLGGVKGAGEAAILNILKAREAGPFKDIYDFCSRIDRRVVNRRSIEALVRAGAFDTLNHGPGADRGIILATVPRAMEAAEQAAQAANQVSLFGDEVAPTKMELVKVPPWTEKQRLTEEKLALGFYFSGHLFNGVAEEVRRFVPTAIAKVNPQRDPQWIAGIIANFRFQNTRRGKMLVLEVDDGSGKLEVTVFSELADAKKHKLKVDELVIVQARIEFDEYSGGLRASAQQLLDLAEARGYFAQALRLQLNHQVDVAQLKRVLEPFRVKGAAVEMPDASQPAPSNNGPAAAGKGAAAPGAAGTSGTPVLISYQGPWGQCDVVFPGHWRVQPAEEMLVALRQIVPMAQVVYG